MIDFDHFLPETDPNQVLAFASDNLSYHPLLLHGSATLNFLEMHRLQPLAFSQIGISTLINQPL